LKTLAGISLILVLILVSLSAYLRLSHSGIGCADWPQCYGHIGQPADADQAVAERLSQTTGEAYQQLLQDSSKPLAWATPLHRLVASVLGLTVLFLSVIALRQKRHRLNALALLALTVYLAVLGIRSGSLHDPAVVMGNLGGGFLMLGLLGWLWFSLAPGIGPGGASHLPASMVVIAIVLLAAQIVLGGLTSANFAATACRSLPDCHGSWWPGPDLYHAMDLSRHHEVTPSGQAIGGPERIAIHKAHRLGALLASLWIAVVGVMAVRRGSPWRNTGLLILLILVFEFAVGVTAVLWELPIGLAVAHNWLAAVLMLGLLRLLSLACESNPAHTHT